MVLVTGALAACSESADDPRVAVPATTVETTSTTSAPPTSKPLPAPWTPSPVEPEPGAKSAAARVVQIIGTYPKGGGEVEATRARLRDAAEDPSLADAALPLLDSAEPGTVEIIYPQLGGLTMTEASVMVVARFTTGDATTVRTVDVRLARGAEDWRPTAIASVGGAPPAASRPSPAGQALLDDDRISLPDSARWDVEAGVVDERVIALVTELATRYRLDVTVFGSGHPENVFGTDRTSNHTAGRGVDIWAIDGVPIAEQQQSDVVLAVIQLALDAGATEVGAPVDPDGPGGRVFMNTVHQDHLHLAFKR